MRVGDIAAACRAFAQGNTQDGIAVVRRIAATEAASGRNAVAQKLLNAIAVGRTPLKPLSSVPGLGTRDPELDLDDLVLSSEIREELDEFVAERLAADRLREAGLPVSRTLFLAGPSGNGKTSICEGIAKAINLPLVVVNYAGLIDSHLGVTSANVDKVFKYVNHHPCVLLFDECDSITATREYGGESASREVARTVNQLMSALDTMADTAVVAFATNFAEVTDAALARRIDYTLQIPAPTSEQLSVLVDRLQQKWPLLASVAGGWRADALSESSFATCTNSVMRSLKRHILQNATVVQA